MIHIKDRRGLIRRLSRVGGQVKGISKMVAEDRYCIDILTQISAAKSALNKVGMIIVGDHMDSCVTSAIKGGKGEESIKELMEVMNRFVK